MLKKRSTLLVSTWINFQWLCFPPHRRPLIGCFSSLTNRCRQNSRMLMIELQSWYQVLWSIFVSLPATRSPKRKCSFIWSLSLFILPLIFCSLDFFFYLCTFSFLHGWCTSHVIILLLCVLCFPRLFFFIISFFFSLFCICNNYEFWFSFFSLFSKETGLQSLDEAKEKVVTWCERLPMELSFSSFHS